MYFFNVNFYSRSPMKIIYDSKWLMFENDDMEI